MINTADLYLGTFLVLSGFVLSVFNLRRIVQKSGSSFSTVLLSENIILMCIGVAFVSRSVYDLNPGNIEMRQIEERSTEIMSSAKQGSVSTNCNFGSVLMSYGPLIVSLVNSFLSLIIDNYVHYRMLENIKENNVENIVQEIQHEVTRKKIEVKTLFKFWKKYFSFIAIAVQWLVPIFMVISMYPMGVTEKKVMMTDLRSFSESCMAMLDVKNGTCSFSSNNYTFELGKHISSPANYLEVYENQIDNNKSEQIDFVLNNVYKIVDNLRNNSKLMNINVTSPYLLRKSKSNQQCIKICFIENKKLLLYMFVLAIFSYFVPITISTMILTKIHVMEMKKANVKTFVSRELLYNILFWTPVMFDTLMSLLLCSYSMNGVRSSLFNVVANVYQAVKNFMNTKYFKNNTVNPI